MRETLTVLVRSLWVLPLFFAAVSCTQIRHRSRSHTPSATKSGSEKADTKYLSATKCSGNVGEIKVLKLEVNKSQDLTICGTLVETLSDTVHILSGIHIFNVDHEDKESQLILDTFQDDSREVLIDKKDKKVLLFEDVVLDKKLPLFSQKISCTHASCYLADKVCLFKKDPVTYAAALKDSGDLKEIMNDPKGQVQVLLAAISGYKPAMEVFAERTPQSMQPKVAATFRLRKQQFELARKICK